MTNDRARLADRRPDADTDEMRAVVEKWIRRMEMNHRGRQGWAPAEPTDAGAIAEAVLMAKRVRRHYTDTGADGDTA